MVDEAAVAGTKFDTLRGTGIGEHVLPQVGPIDMWDGDGLAYSKGGLFFSTRELGQNVLVLIDGDSLSIDEVLNDLSKRGEPIIGGEFQDEVFFFELRSSGHNIGRLER